MFDVSSLSAPQLQSPSLRQGSSVLPVGEQSSKRAFGDYLADAKSELTFENFLQSRYVGKSVSFKLGKGIVRGMVTEVGHLEGEYYIKIWNRRKRVVGSGFFFLRHSITYPTCSQLSRDINNVQSDAGLNINLHLKFVQTDRP